MDALRARPRSEPLAEALTVAMVGSEVQHEPDKAMLRLMVCDPVLRGEFLKATSSVHRQLAEAIADRAGMDADTDLLPNVISAAYQGVARAAVWFWLGAERAQPLSAVLREALTALAPLASAVEAGVAGAARATAPAPPASRSALAHAGRT